MFHSNAKQMYCIKYFAFALSGLGLQNFFLCISLFIKFTMCFQQYSFGFASQRQIRLQAWFQLGSDLKVFGLPRHIYKMSSQKRNVPIFFILSIKERKIISFVDETAMYSDTSSCCNLLFHCQCTENCCWRLLVWLEILMQLSKT